MDTFSEAMTKNPLVIDNGSGYIKAGLTGEEKPTCIIPSFVGRAKHKAVLPTKNQEFNVTGNISDEMRGLLKIRYAMEHGIIKHWDDMDLIWKKVFNQLELSQKDQPVFMTEPPLTPYNQKFKVAQVFFEQYQVPAYFSATQGVLSLWSTSKTTGVVLDSGDGVSHCVPVFEGFNLTNACTRVDLAGRDVTEHLALLLRMSGQTFTTSAEFDTVRKIKEKRCLVNLSAQPDEDLLVQKVLKDPYILPDGRILEIASEKFRAPEILFQPEKIGLECMSLPELLISSVNKADMDLRKTLYNEIVLAGGTTMTQGFAERFIYEMRQKAPAEIHIKLQAPKERNISTWIGGSVLANLSSFKQWWITKADYEDQGERILLKRSF